MRSSIVSRFIKIFQSDATQATDAAQGAKAIGGTSHNGDGRASEARDQKFVESALEVMLAEFSALRAEVVTVKEQMERTYAYLLASVGGIAASQLLSASVLAKVNAHPIIYLLVALTALWFPANHMCMATDMACLGLYLRDVLYPKINTVVAVAGFGEGAGSGETNGAKQDCPTSTKWPWSASVDVAPRLKAGGQFMEPISWESFNPWVRYGGRSREIILAPLFFIRNLILFAPSALTVAIFLAHARRVDIGEGILLGIISVVSLTFVGVSFSVVGLVAYGKRGVKR